MKKFQMVVLVIILAAMTVVVQASSTIINDTSVLKLTVKVWTVDSHGYKVGDTTELAQSGSFLTPIGGTQKGKFEINTSIIKGDNISIKYIKVERQGAGPVGAAQTWTYNSTSVSKTTDWPGTGLYKISVVAVDQNNKEKASSVLSVQINTYTPAADGVSIRYKTLGLTVRELVDDQGIKTRFNPCVTHYDTKKKTWVLDKNPELEVRTSDGKIIEEDWNKIAAAKGVINDGRVYTVKGAGIIVSYNYPAGTWRKGPFYPDASEILKPLPYYTSINPENEKNYFTGQLWALINCEWWSASTSYNDFPNSCTKELVFRAPVKGVVIIEKKIKEGDTITDYKDGSENKLSLVKKAVQRSNTGSAKSELIKTTWQNINNTISDTYEPINIYSEKANTVYVDEGVPSEYQLVMNKSKIEYSIRTLKDGAGALDLTKLDKIQWESPTYFENIQWESQINLKSGKLNAVQIFQKPNIRVTLVYEKTKPTNGARFGMTATPEAKTVVKTATIDSEAKILVEMKQSSKDILTKWKNFIKGRNDLKLSIKVTGTTPKGYTPQISLTSPTPPVSSPTLYNPNGTYAPISETDLVKLLETNLKITYTDKIHYATIAEEETVPFIYNVEVKVKVGTEEFVLAPNKGTDTVEFYREKVIIIEKGGYESRARAYSEIKEGYPSAETFEAMAGVPTNRYLYFGSGGSEFIVEFETEYVQDTETTRTYRSHYTGGVDCEFKSGDTAPNQSLGGQSANLHGGGTYTKTWSGSIPNKATAVTALHSASCPAQPDRSAYDSALAEANAFAAEVNGTTLSFTSASDKKNRSQTGWSASVSASPNDPQSTSASVPCDQKAEVTETTTSGTPPVTTTKVVSPAVPCHNEMATANPGGAGSYTITVTWTVPAHVICGPCCTHVMSSIEDRWSQKVTFDHMKINVARVWKINNAFVNGMTDITGTDEVKATVISGDPNIFYNKSTQNKSTDGRLRYTIETNQHDTVEWYEGARTNKCNGLGNNGVSSGSGHASSWATGILYTNSTYTNTKDYHVSNSDAKDKATTEWQKFNERRTAQNVATVVSDMLILQTSSGDQSVFYFHKASTSKQTQENFDKVSATKQEMWDNNPYSAAKWTADQINIGSYNGNFSSPLAKYNGTGNGSTVPTIFDTMPAGLSRPARPTSPLRLLIAGLDIFDTIPNREYVTGSSSVFYKVILNVGSGTPSVSTAFNSRFGDYGYEKESKYSENHTKVNDIVVHNPVSAEYAIVMSLASDRDQRTTGTRPPIVTPTVINCPGSPGECEFAEQNCRYYINGGTSQHTPQCYIPDVSQDVTWTSLTGVAASGNNITQTAVNGWNSGASSMLSQTVGDWQYAETTVAETNTHRMFGLSRSDSNPDYTSIEYAMYLRADGNIEIYESGINRGNKGSYATGDKLRIAIENSTIKYYRNDNCIYTSTVAPASLPMVIDCSTYTVGATINDVKIFSQILNCTEPHHNGGHYDTDSPICWKACNNDANHNYKTTVDVSDLGTFSQGNFINLDYPFYIYFPSRGNFQGNDAWGITGTTSMRGKGYTNTMDTSPYTGSKAVTFGFNVIYDGKAYMAGERIILSAEEEIFEFYCSLANYEATGKDVKFDVIATNGIGLDNTDVANRARGSARDAKHSGIKTFNVDVVGRIGNMTIDDTGDFRFANFFKLPVSGNQWIVPNVVKKVNPETPNKIIGSSFDIRGNPIGPGTQYLNTYGHLKYLEQPPVGFPLSPEKNNIKALQRNPMRLGYNVFASIQTIGNYYDSMEINLFYYHLDLISGEIKPVDVYMNVNASYEPINFHGGAPAGKGVYDFKAVINWDAEKKRRNYSDLEDMITRMACASYGLQFPGGSRYAIGNSQTLVLGGGARTFIGNSSTYGQYKNPDEALPISLFNVQAQRWHFTYGLPSSAVFVEKGAVANKTNIDKLRNSNSLILVGADIKAYGDPYYLQYTHTEGNSDIVINGVSYPIPETSIPRTQAVLSVYATNKTSADDMTVRGTH